MGKTRREAESLLCSTLGALLRTSKGRMWTSENMVRDVKRYRMSMRGGEKRRGNGMMTYPLSPLLLIPNMKPLLGARMDG